MKHFFRLTFTLLAGITLCACSSDGDDSLDNKPTPVQPGEASSDDTWGVEVEDDVTRGLSLSGTTLTPTFNNENIYVYYNNTKVGTLKPSATGSGTKVLTGRLNNAEYAVGQSLYLYFLKDKGFNTYTGQKGTIADIAANFDYATATGSITKIDEKTHTLTISKASFAGHQAIIGFKFSEALNASDVITISGAASSVTATMASAVTANSTVVYFALPLSGNSARTFNFTVKRGSTANALKGSFTTASGKTMQNGKYYSTQTVTLYRHMTLAVSGDKGKVIGSDGYIYPSSTSVTKTGVIVYVGSGTGVSGKSHGIALSMTNGSKTNYTTNATTIKGSLANVPSGASAWAIPSLAQWNTILTSLKGGDGLTDSNQTIYANVNPGGGATYLNQIYWSTTASSSSGKNWCYRAPSGYGCRVAQGTGSGSDYTDYIRAIYAF